MRKSLIAAGLSVFAIGTAGAARAADMCPSDAYTGSGPTLQATPLAIPTLCTDHPIFSPSGVYSAELQDDGDFVEWRGSNVLVNSNVAWALPGHGYPGNVGPLAFTARLQEDGNFVISGPNNNLLGFAATNSAQSSTGNYYATLNDNGAFTINAGTPSSSGKQIYSNGVNNPVKELNLTSIDYDFHAATISNETPVAGIVFRDVNNTSTKQIHPITLSLEHTDTQTFSWNTSEAVTLGIETTTSIGVPGLVDEFTVNLATTTTVSKGESTSSGDATTFQAEDDLAVPAHSTYEAFILAAKGSMTVPYTFSGTAIYDSGQSAAVSGSGVFAGVSTGAFEIEEDCVSSPTNCAGVLPTIIPVGLNGVAVPEPATWAMMLLGFAGLALTGYRRGQAGRA